MTLRVVLILLSLLIVRDESVCNSNDQLANNSITKGAIVVPTEKKKLIVHTTKDVSVKKFLDKLAYLESGNNPLTVSPTGYVGKYQIRYKFIKSFGFNVTQDEFLQNENLQDSVAIALLKYNKKILHKYIEQYSGQVFDSVYVTEAGILGGAHLVGAGGVMSFFNQDTLHPVSDGNGVSVKRYLRIFSTYHLKGI